MDNTLWGGIVGEDGFDGIKLGPNPPGSAYMDFQKYILALFRRGIILAVNSNNNRTDAIRVLREHPHMVLGEHHFASLKINWESKAKNLVDIAKDINIGLNSMIYLDDDKRNRELIKESLPEVLCPDLPEDPSYYTRFLMNVKDMDALQITREDKKRGRLYAQEKKRKASISVFKDISKYLAHLKIVTEIKLADKFSIPRLSQLTLRTNQFNFSTKRYNENQIKAFVSDKRYDVYYVRVKDKYGDYGITGAVIIQKNKEVWLIDTFLMSCRVLGKKIEDAVLSVVIKKAARENVDKVKIDYRKTEKNAPVANFLKRHEILKQAEPKDTILTLYRKGRNSKLGRQTEHLRILFK